MAPAKAKTGVLTPALLGAGVMVGTGVAGTVFSVDRVGTGP